MASVAEPVLSFLLWVSMYSRYSCGFVDISGGGDMHGASVTRTKKGSPLCQRLKHADHAHAVFVYRLVCKLCIAVKTPIEILPVRGANKHTYTSINSACLSTSANFFEAFRPCRL